MEIGDQQSFSSGPCHNGSRGSPNQSCVYFSNSGMHHGCRHIQQLIETPSQFPDLGWECYYVWKVQVEATRLSFSRKIINQKQYSIEWFTEINATNKDLKDVEVP